MNWSVPFWFHKLCADGYSLFFSHFCLDFNKGNWETIISYGVFNHTFLCLTCKWVYFLTLQEIFENFIQLLGFIIIISISFDFFVCELSRTADIQTLPLQSNDENISRKCILILGYFRSSLANFSFTWLCWNLEKDWII